MKLFFDPIIASLKKESARGKSLFGVWVTCSNAGISEFTELIESET